VSGRAASRERPRSAGWRRAAAAAVVAWAALWPLVHRFLVARYEIHPWKLGGFAMYTTWVDTHVALFEPMGDRLALIDERSLPEPALAALVAFRGARGALGRFSRPDELAATVFAERPRTRALLVVVQRQWLDRESARIASSKVTFPYERKDGG